MTDATALAKRALEIKDTGKVGKGLLAYYSEQIGYNVRSEKIHLLIHDLNNERDAMLCVCAAYLSLKAAHDKLLEKLPREYDEYREEVRAIKKEEAGE